MARPRKAAAQPAAPKAAAVDVLPVASTIPALTLDLTKMSTRDLLVFQELSLVQSMTPAQQQSLTLKCAPMLDRLIVGGMPDLPIAQYGDLLAAFFTALQEQSGTKN